MELRQLEMLVAVAEAGNVTRAAQTLRVAQPSVSAQIRALEDELGQPLFDRLPRGMRLTEAGHVVLAHARRILRHVEEIGSDLDELLGMRRGRLALGTMPTLTAYLIPTVIKRFRSAYPAVELSVVEARSSSLMDDVAAHRLDLAVVTAPEGHPQVELTHLFDEELVAILPADDPLADRDEVRLHELAERPFLMLEPGFGLRVIVWDACRTAGFAPRVTLETESIQTIKSLVEIGMGVSLVPGMTAVNEERLGLLRSVRVRDPRPSRPVHLATARGAHVTRAAQAFIALCRELAEGKDRLEDKASR
jgi:DNA-binding transcriptional LysR family regulator